MQLSYFSRKAATLSLALSCVSTGVFVVSEPAQAAVSSVSFANHTASGQTSQYSVYASNINWAKSVGVVFYLDGDYWTRAQSKVWNYDNADLKAMADEANARNMVFVTAVSPDKNAGGDGITWWENQEDNANWFRSFADTFIRNTGIDRSNVWVVGYSGGAEIISLELNADRQESWRSGGGSILIGGGTPGVMQTSASSRFKSVPIDFYVGSRDGVGATWPATWSAQGASQAGVNFYRANGFTNVDRKVVSGGHYAYDLPMILGQSLDEAGRRDSAGIALRGAIGDYYTSTGGAAVYGAPQGKEFPVRGGGYAQRFGSVYTIYWHSNVGTAPVRFSSAIGVKYTSAGYENGSGFPLFEETAISGGAVQKFALPDRRVTAYYWSTSHQRVHTVWESGAIGGRFTRAGGTGAYGFPITDEYSLGYGGVAQRFKQSSGQESVFVWSPPTGAKVLNANGSLYWYWRNSGYIGKYGFPTTDEAVQQDGSVTVEFSNGYRLTWSTGGVKESRK